MIGSPRRFLKLFILEWMYTGVLGASDESSVSGEDINFLGEVEFVDGAVHHPPV